MIRISQLKLPCGHSRGDLENSSGWEVESL